jgi:hypothetical protein
MASQGGHSFEVRWRAKAVWYLQLGLPAPEGWALETREYHPYLSPELRVSSEQFIGKERSEEMENETKKEGKEDRKRKAALGVNLHSFF